ncbi:MAG: matrixin family metalloprotease [gamma proteobacterium symbiont of Taylorina sp.]|nr:matrixin family metalloprotease [gamma proteobacterium symbiont of Taylorina sp.]
MINILKKNILFFLLLSSLFVYILLAITAPANAAEWPKKKYTIIYKVTSHMWDTKQKKVVRTTKKVLDDIHYAFDVWQDASNGTLRFTFGGFGKAGYDGYNQIPYDGDIYLVLNGRYNDHGEMANARYSGTIPDDYKKAGIFFNKQSGSLHHSIITHEIGHVLGLEHAATNASIMYSGKRSGGSTLIDYLAEQDVINLQYLWDPDNKNIFTMSGSIQTSHKHKMALVFAVNTFNGHTYSTRSDHKGNYTIVLGQPGRYKVVAKSVEVSADLKALKNKQGIPQSASWYVDQSVSSTNPAKALRTYMFRSRPHTKGAIIQMIDQPAPYKLTRALSSQDNFELGYLHPGDDVMLGLPEVNNLESIESFGTSPDYQFLAVPKKYKGQYQVKLHIADNATEGERLAIVRDTQGRSHIGLIGIHISHQQAKPKLISGKALIAQLSFDHNLNDSGPYKMQGQVNGDEVSLRKGIKGNGLFVGGSEDWLDLPLPDQLLLESGFTSEFWFRRENWSNPYIGGAGFQTLVAITSSFVQDITAEGCALTPPWALVSTVSHRNLKNRESETVRAYTKPDIIQPNIWLHAATVYDPFESSLSLYLDGKLVETIWAVPAPLFSIRHIRFGTWFKANQAFRGMLDEFKLYNYARTAQEIKIAAQPPD